MYRGTFSSGMSFHLNTLGLEKLLHGDSVDIFDGIHPTQVSVHLDEIALTKVKDRRLYEQLVAIET